MDSDEHPTFYAQCGVGLTVRAWQEFYFKGYSAAGGPFETMDEACAFLDERHSHCFRPHSILELYGYHAQEYTRTHNYSPTRG